MKNVFENIKNFVITHKTVCIVCCAVLVVGVGTALIVSNALKKDPEPEREEVLTNYLIEMGKDFYESYYYDAVGSSEESRKNFLQKYSEIGIKVSLDNLSRYNSAVVTDRINEFFSNNEEEDCNRENSKVIIYPQSPYGKTDYRIDTILKCGLE